MISIAAAAALLALALLEPRLRPAALPLALFLLGHGVGGLLHERRRHVAGYLAAFAGLSAAIYAAPMPIGDWRKALLVGVALGFLLNFIRFHLGRAKRLLAPASVAVVAAFLGLFLKSTGLPYLPGIAWGVGAGGALASALGLLRGPAGRFFARRAVFFAAVGGLSAALYELSAAVGQPLYLAAAAVAVLGLMMPLSEAARARPYDDPDVLEAKRVEARFVSTGDAALLAAYVAYHLAKAGASERAVAEAVRLALSYRDLKPSPFAPGLVARLVERANKRRRIRHLERVKGYLRRYL